MSTRHELTDEQWAIIEPLLPKPKPGPGRPPADPRKTLNGILYVLKTGCTWADMPRQYGSPTTCWRRLKQWSEDGTWERIWRALLSRMDAEEKIEWSQAFLDGRFVPAKKGEKGTKVMMVSDGNGVPIGLYLDSAHHHEIRLAEATLKTVRVPQRRGRPRTRPKELVADKAYDSRSFRIWLRRRGIKPTIPTIQRKSRKPRRGRPIRVGEGYRRRWIIERCFGWMNNYRRLVVRYDRYLHIYRAFCLIAFIIWCVNRILK